MSEKIFKLMIFAAILGFQKIMAGFFYLIYLNHLHIKKDPDFFQA
jgi:hypothetical protein